MARKAGTPNKPKVTTEVVSTQELPPEQAMTELVKLTQELDLYDTLIPTVDITDTIEAPTETAEEESEEVSTNVAPIVETPVKASQELLDFAGNPIPTTAIKINKHINVYHLIDDVLHASYLGGDLDKSFYPVIKGVPPYEVRMVIPTDKLEQWNNREGKSVVEGDGLLASVAAYDDISFIKHLIILGKKGYVLAPAKPVLTFGRYIATLKGRIPVPKDLNLSIDPSSILVYSKEELKTFDIYELKTIGSWYNINHRSKDALIKMILEAQEGNTKSGE